MHIDPALLSPVSALCGALVGGSASFAAAMYTQRSQQRLQRIASDVAKREKVYAEFVMRASNLLLNAYIRDDIALGSDEQRLVALINRMRLFAAPAVVTAGEAVLRAICGSRWGRASMSGNSRRKACPSDSIPMRWWNSALSAVQNSTACIEWSRDAIMTGAHCG